MRSAASSYVLAIAVTAAAVALRWLLDPWLDERLALVTLPAAVALAVWLGGAGPAVVAAVAGYLASDYLFIGTPGALDIGDAGGGLGLLMYLASSLAIIALGDTMRAARNRAREREQRMRQSERELADFFENASVALHWVGPDGTILRANRAELDLLGYEQDEYVGRHVRDFHADQDRIAELLGRLSRGETVRGYPATLRRKDGSTRDVLISSSAYFEGGRFVHTRSFTIDVTDRMGPEERLRASEERFRLEIQERRSTEDALRDSEARFRAVFETAIDGIITIDERGIIDSVNPAVERLFGYPAGELVGRNVSLLMPQPYRREHDSYLGNYRRTRQPKIIGIGREVIGRRKDGTEFPMDLAVSELTLRGRPMFTGLVRDITERKRAEQELLDADRRKTEFLATLAHELRNPLAPIRNALEIIKVAEDDRELLRRGRHTIERQLAHLVRLVDDLLDISRISRDLLELRTTRVALAPVIRQVVETYRPVCARQRQQLEVTLPPHEVELDADPVRLAQVFSNLLDNACKYTPEQGAIAIDARQDGGQLVVSVKDTGIGIPPEKLHGIFEMFTQVDTTLERSRAGLGIGLTLVKRLVELHGGTIEARSEGAGRGSEFLVRLPVAQAAPAEVPAPPVAPPRAARQRVLVVDDNRDSTESLALLLDLGGHETRMAFDGAEAIEVAEAFRPEIVLLDIGLPKLNGLEVCRRLRQRPWGGDMLIVALTGWGQDEDRRQSADAGFDDHLVKPVDHDALVRLLSSRDRQPG